jgi:hypothetical protein
MAIQVTSSVYSIYADPDQAFLVNPDPATKRNADPGLDPVEMFKIK